MTANVYYSDDADPAHEVAQTVPDEDRRDFVQARQLPHQAERIPQHGRGASRGRRVKLGGLLRVGRVLVERLRRAG